MTTPKRNSESQEARWVLRAQLGDVRALDLLLASIQERLLRFLVQRLSSEADAEDCAQQVLMLICRKLGRLREPRAFRPWMYRIAMRESGRRFRQLARETQLEEQPAADAHNSPLAGATEPETPLLDLVPGLHEQIQQLPPNSSAVLFLHYVEGLTLVEISKVLDKPIGTIKSRLAYGLGKLRERIKETENE